MQFNTLNMAFVREIECNQCENWFVEEHFKSHVVIEHMKFGQDEPNVQVGAFCGEVREVWCSQSENRAQTLKMDDCDQLLRSSVEVSAEMEHLLEPMVLEILDNCIQKAVEFKETDTAAQMAENGFPGGVDHDFWEKGRNGEIHIESSWFDSDMEEDDESRECVLDKPEEEKQKKIGTEVEIDLAWFEENMEVDDYTQSQRSNLCPQNCVTVDPDEKRDEKIGIDFEIDSAWFDEEIEEKDDTPSLSSHPCVDVKEQNIEKASRAVGNFQDYVSGKSSFGRGIILAKAGPKQVSSVQAAHSFHSNMTLADENGETVNCTIWSENEAETDMVRTQFHVGDVIQFRNLAVRKKSEVKYDELDPETTSSYKLKYIRGQSGIRKIAEKSFKGKDERLSMPFPANGISVDLADVVKDKTLHNKYVTVVGTVKETTHDIRVGKDQMMAAILLSVGDISVKLKLWENEQREQAKNWNEGQQLQAAGVKVETDAYRGNVCLAGSSKTVLVRLM